MPTKFVQLLNYSFIHSLNTLFTKFQVRLHSLSVLTPKHSVSFRTQGESNHRAFMLSKAALTKYLKFLNFKDSLKLLNGLRNWLTGKPIWMKSNIFRWDQNSLKPSWLCLLAFFQLLYKTEFKLC